MDTEPHLWCWISGYLVALGSLAYSSFLHFDWVVFYLNHVGGLIEDYYVYRRLPPVGTYRGLLCLSRIAPLI